MQACTLFSRFSGAGASLLAAGTLLFAGSALAADMNSAREAYRVQRAACESGQTQDRANCLREAGAALEEAQRGRLMSRTAQDYDANARMRCEQQSADRREECLLLQGPDATIFGSVEGGGTLRELTVRRAGEPPVPPERGVVTTPQNIHPRAVPQNMPRPQPVPGMPGSTMPPGTGIR